MNGRLQIRSRGQRLFLSRRVQIIFLSVTCNSGERAELPEMAHAEINKEIKPQETPSPCQFRPTFDLWMWKWQRMRQESELAQFSQDMLIIHPFISSTASFETWKIQGINVGGDNRQDVAADLRLQFTAAGAWLSGKAFHFYFSNEISKSNDRKK